MRTLQRHCAALIGLLALSGLAAPVTADVNDLIDDLNSHNSIKGSESTKGWRILFDEYLKLSAPPQEVGPFFNLETIWPGMTGWSEVSNWAKSNPGMAQAIIEASQRTIVGLPYGMDNVPATYQQKNVFIEIWSKGKVRNNRFAYLDALQEILAYSTAETYRLFEEGKSAEAIDLAIAQLWLLRKFADRDFLEEKRTAMELLIISLQNMRDCFWSYADRISDDQFTHIAQKEIPYLRTDRGRLAIPEADRKVAREIFNQVFEPTTGDADPDRFLEVFTEIQAENEPLGRFGAGRRWVELAATHGGLPATQERLTNIFDDWWRRWRINEYSAMLGMETEYDKTNSTRYAAVLFIIDDIVELFDLRKLLLSETRGTVVAAALCSYRADRGRFPKKMVALYPNPLSKQQSVDVFNEELYPMQYKYISSRTAIDIGVDRVWLEEGNCVVFSFGPDLEQSSEGGMLLHGIDEDIFYWPPAKAIVRGQQERK